MSFQWQLLDLNFKEFCIGSNIHEMFETGKYFNRILVAIALVCSQPVAKFYVDFPLLIWCQHIKKIFRKILKAGDKYFASPASSRWNRENSFASTVASNFPDMRVLPSRWILQTVAKQSCAIFVYFPYYVENFSMRNEKNAQQMNQ